MKLEIDLMLVRSPVTYRQIVKDIFTQYPRHVPKSVRLTDASKLELSIIIEIV